MVIRSRIAAFPLFRERNAVIRSRIATFPLFLERNAVIRSRIAVLLPFWERNAVIRFRAGRRHGAPSRYAGPFPFREPKAP